PASLPLGEVLAGARERHLVAWRHFPRPGRTSACRDLCARRRGGRRPREILGAHAGAAADAPRRSREPARGAGAPEVDPERALESMRAGTGADRVVDDVASARASGVGASPALFVNGEYYRGELEPDAVIGALDHV